MFDLTTEQQELIEWAEDFARTRLAPTAFTWQEPTKERIDGQYDLLFKQGLLGLNMPEEYGGGGRATFDAMLVVEAVSRHCPFSGSLVRNTVASPIVFLQRLASEEHRRAYLADCVRGAKAVSVCITEPDAGSASGEMRSRIEQVGNELVLNGAKLFISHADRAGVFIAYAKFGAADGPMCAVLVPAGTPGLTVGPAIDWVGGQVFHVNFDNVRLGTDAWVVPPAGKESMKSLFSVYNVERLGGLFELLGVADLALTKSATYAGVRRQFGRPIGANQAVAFRLADMAMRTRASRLLCYAAAAKTGTAGGAPKLDVSMARVMTAEMVQFVLDQAMHIHGGYGLTKEVGLEWLYRITRHHTIAGGTSDMHRQMIARELIPTS